MLSPAYNYAPSEVIRAPLAHLAFLLTATVRTNGFTHLLRPNCQPHMDSSGIYLNLPRSNYV